MFRLFNATDLVKLAGAEPGEFYRVRVERSWARSTLLVAALATTVLLLLLLVNFVTLPQTVAMLNMLALSTIIVMLGIYWTLFTTVRGIWERREGLALTTQELEIKRGEGIRCIPFSEVVKTRLRGRLLNKLTRTRVGHLQLELASGEKLYFRDLDGAPLIEHCIVFRRDVKNKG